MSAPRVPAGVSGENAAALDAFATHLKSRTPHTRTAYLRDVTQPASCRALPMAKLERPQLMRFVGHCTARLSGEALRAHSAWRVFYRFLIERDGTLKDDPAPASRRPNRADCRPRFRPRKREARDDRQRRPARHPRPRTVRARLLSGLRRPSLAQLDIEGCDLTTGEVRVFGKGSKERIVPVGTAARDAITRWLGAGRARGAAETAMFIGVAGAGCRCARSSSGCERAIRQGLSRHVHPTCCAIRRVAMCSSRRAICAPCRRCRARVDRQHAGVHASRFPGNREGIRRRAPAREAQAVEVKRLTVAVISAGYLFRPANILTGGVQNGAGCGARNPLERGLRQGGVTSSSRDYLAAHHRTARRAC